MSDDPSSNRVARLVPRASDFEIRVHRLAADSRNIKLTMHARERMRERDISIRTVFTVLREGSVCGEIEFGNNPGEFKAKLTLNVKGRREVGVVVLTINGDLVVVKTVEWEDMR